jgi:hypothetical protein
MIILRERSAAAFLHGQDPKRTWASFVQRATARSSVVLEFASSKSPYGQKINRSKKLTQIVDEQSRL